MQSKLKPCPFCGGEAEIIEIDEGENAGGSCVCCTRCLASSNVEFEFKENFIDNWNRRADLCASGQVRAEAVLDAANNYLTNQYGISALGHPVDRQRILAALTPAPQPSETVAEAAYLAGFMASSEGYNGEYPGIEYEHDARWCFERDTALRALKGEA